jgi:hypothetical protein
VSDTLLITMRHVRRAKMCARGARLFCERHGLDLRALRAPGLPVKQVLATGDAMALRVVEVARGR